MGDATIELYADDGGAGDGLPVLFLHSLAGNAGQWAAQLAHLRATRRAVALDWRGHGRSPAPADGDWSPQAAARDVAATVERLGVGRCVVVGHSAGALVALAYAARHPERVAGVLLVDPAGEMRRLPAEMIDPFVDALQGDAYAKTIDDYWRSIAGQDPAVRERLMADLHATPQATVTGIFRALRDFEAEPVLSGYRGPRLSLITPLNDGPSTLHHIDPSLPRRPITGTGHWIQLERPDEVNRIIDEFIRSVENAG